MRCVISSKCAIEWKLYPQITDRETVCGKKGTKKQITPTPESAFSIQQPNVSSCSSFFNSTHTTNMHLQNWAHCNSTFKWNNTYIFWNKWVTDAKLVYVWEKYDAKRKCYTRFISSEIQKFSISFTIFASWFCFRSK